MLDPIFGLLGEDPFSTNTGDTVNFTSRTLDGYAPIVSPGGDIPVANVTEGDTLAKPYFSIKDMMTVEYESYVHNKLGLVLDDAMALRERTLNTAALALTGQFLNCANAGTQSIRGTVQTILTADGQYMGDSDHTVPGSGTKTYSNVLTGLDALSETALTSLEQQLKANNPSDGGTIMPFVADLLFVPDNADMIKKALQLTGSTLVSESNNNAVNIYSGGRLDVAVLKQAPRDAIGGYDTTKQYFWGLANKKQLKRAIKYTWAVKPSDIKQGGLVPKFQDKNLDSSIIVFARLVYGAPRWQGVGYSFSVTKPVAP